MRRALPLALALWAACGPPAPPPAPPPRDLDAEAHAAATRFVRCYERDGAECRHPEAPYRAWSALRALLDVRDRSPAVLVEALSRAFTELRDDRLARRAFIQELKQREAQVRVAACEPTTLRQLGGTIEALRAAAQQRIVDLGLGDTAPGSAVGELAQVALGLHDTREVRLSCRQGLTLYLVMAPTSEGAWYPVDVSDEPAQLSAGASAGAEPLTLTVEGRDALDAWLPFGEDQL